MSAGTDTDIPMAFSVRRFRCAARIVAVCDVYDAMTHDKAYRRALSSDEAHGRNAAWSRAAVRPEVD